MAQNLVTKYSDIIDERFSAQSLTEAAVNHDYDFVGAQPARAATAPPPSWTTPPRR